MLPTSGKVSPNGSWGRCLGRETKGPAWAPSPPAGLRHPLLLSEHHKRLPKSCSLLSQHKHNSPLAQKYSVEARTTKPRGLWQPREPERTFLHVPSSWGQKAHLSLFLLLRVVFRCTSTARPSQGAWDHCFSARVPIDVGHNRASFGPWRVPKL